MLSIRVILAAWCILFGGLVALAGEPAKDFQPRPFRSPAGERTLEQVLKDLQEQTGNAIVDRRGESNRANPTLTLKSKTFWETLDAIGAQSGIGFSAYQPSRAVALIDTPYRKKMMIHHGGLFRFAVRRVTATRDDETGAHFVDVALDIAWEPRLEPILINLEGGVASFGNKAQKLARQGVLNVAGAGATDKIELRLLAPPRQQEEIKSLHGELRVLAPPRMLEFAFAGLKEKERRSAKQEGVIVTVAGLKKATKLWSLDLVIQNPEGAIPELESFRAQSWLDNNRLWLTWTDPRTKKKQTLMSGPFAEYRDGTSEKMRIAFALEPSEKTPLPPPGADVTLHYRTPSRVTAFTVPFAFRDLPLP
ncbi:MAG: hypothetical protein HYX68_15530 [Planctomycetes bacterium]|nr:hypothetical protein [Planctomycetota bacterium]